MLFVGMISKSAPPSAIKSTKLLFHVIKAATNQLNNTNFGSGSNDRHGSGGIAYCFKCLLLQVYSDTNSWIFNFRFQTAAGLCRGSDLVSSCSF